MSLLKVTDLVVSYGGIEALKGISFEVDQGQIVTLIGANGAGKSTTLRTISGLVPPKDGRIYFEGRDITDLNTQKIHRRRHQLCVRPLPPAEEALLAAGRYPVRR